jgi:hypothetical protein
LCGALRQASSFLSCFLSASAIFCLPNAMPVFRSHLAAAAARPRDGKFGPRPLSTREIVQGLEIAGSSHFRLAKPTHEAKGQSYRDSACEGPKTCSESAFGQRFVQLFVRRQRKRRGFGRASSSGFGRSQSAAGVSSRSEMSTVSSSAGSSSNSNCWRFVRSSPLAWRSASSVERATLTVSLEATSG